MRIVVAGAGPAGLYCAYLIKKRRRDVDLTIFEQNPANATFGFGVVFSDRALEFLGADDPETLAAIMPHLELWNDIMVVHRGERIVIDGIGFAAIGRLKLLSILQKRLYSVGVVPRYSHVIRSIEEFGPADLVVAADGANSFVRDKFASVFGTSTTFLSNRFAWFGTRRAFETLTQTFRRNDLGYFNAHHYRYDPDMSTFIVEVDAETFARNGFGEMSEEEARHVCERVFEEDLAGEKLVSNRSIWRRFPNVRNRHWSHDRYVLVGDALRTAHFSIGSGTRLAIEDAIALERALYDTGYNIPAALEGYEVARRPIVEKLLEAADSSARWYESFPQHMRLQPMKFAMSYIQRSGRVDFGKLRLLSPKFVAAYEEQGLSEGYFLQ